MVLRTHVLGTCFYAMVAVAQGLPIALVPEQNWIATMWNDVVDVGRQDELAFPHAFHT